MAAKERLEEADRRKNHDLLQNSAKFTPCGGRVLVTVEADAGAGQAVIRVADTGLGMKPELLARLPAASCS